MRYDEALAWLNGHINLERIGPRAPGELSLDGIRALMDVLGDPQDAAPTIHITGTNGKGSTARVVTALLVELGLTVGTYTSPHLQRINERMRIDGRALSDDECARALELVAAAAPLADVTSSYFELLAAAGYAYFADVPTSANVIEVGAGGRHDATNVVSAEVAVVTNVGLDHLDYFGPTIHHVAAEKAGIIEEGAHLVLGADDPELRHHFLDQRPGTVWVLGDDIEVQRNEIAVGGRVLDVRTPMATYTDLFLPLHGAHQGRNAALGLAAVAAFLARSLGGEVVAAASPAATSSCSPPPAPRAPRRRPQRRGCRRGGRDLRLGVLRRRRHDPGVRVQQRSGAGRDARVAGPDRPPHRRGHRP